MDFSEALKKKVRKKSHGFCCMCKEPWDVEIHHVIPQEEDGPATEDNAAPLCGRCHNLFGANPQKRKTIREHRDVWYEICENRFTLDATWANKIASGMDSTTEQLASIQGTLLHLMAEVSSKDDASSFGESYNGMIGMEFASLLYCHIANSFCLSRPDGVTLYKLLHVRHMVVVAALLKVMERGGLALTVSFAETIRNTVSDVDSESVRSILDGFRSEGAPPELVAPVEVFLDMLSDDA